MSPATDLRRRHWGWRCGSRGASSPSPVSTALTGCASSTGSCTSNVPATAPSRRSLSLAIQPDNARITVGPRRPSRACCCTAEATVDWIEPPGGPAAWPAFQATGRSTTWTCPIGDGLLLLTDGLFEGHSGLGDERLGEDGLLALARSLAALPGPQFVDALDRGSRRTRSVPRRASPMTSQSYGWSGRRLIDEPVGRSPPVRAPVAVHRAGLAEPGAGDHGRGGARRRGDRHSSWSTGPTPCRAS